MIEAALDLFVERGYAATKVDEVAARAGVSKGTLFLYFPSKEDLFKAVARHNLARHFTEWDVEIEHYPHSTSELLRYAYELWWGAYRRHQGLRHLQAGVERSAQLSRHRGVLPQRGRASGQPAHPPHPRARHAAGEFRKLDLDCAVHVVAAPLVFMMMWRHSGVCMPASDEVTPQRFIDAQVDSLLAGFCVRQDAPAAQPRAKRAVRAPKMDGLS